MYKKNTVSHLKKNIKVVWVSAEFNLSGTFMFIDKKKIPLNYTLSSSDSGELVNVMSPQTKFHL